MISDKLKEETIFLVNLFLQTNKSDQQLSLLTNLSRSTIGRRLTNEKVIKECFPDNPEIYDLIRNKRQENLKKAKILGGQSSLLNNNHLKLDILYSDEEKQYKFLAQLALTYRTKLDLLSDLFQIDEEILLNNLLKYNSNLSNSLNYLFNRESYIEDIAKYNTVLFYKNLVNALLKKDNNYFNKVINEISDKDIQEFLNKPKDILNNKDILMLLKYQLKYSLSNKTMSNIFNIDELIYTNLLKNILNHNIELNNRYNELINNLKEVEYGKRDI